MPLGVENVDEKGWLSCVKLIVSNCVGSDVGGELR
jgi:hypothetical protein